MVKSESSGSTVVLRGGRIIDVAAGKIISGDILIRGDVVDGVFPGGIGTVDKADTTVIDLKGRYAAPGLIDAHLHIESSLLAPAEFAAQALRHGTTAMFVDPHEIANVCGRKGIDFFLAHAGSLPCAIHLGIPSCVPATVLEDAGAAITLDDVRALLPDPRVYGLAEMMNYPGIIHGIGDARAKVDAALAAGKLADGHCPRVGGGDLQAYITNGRLDGVVRIGTDHESTSGGEALEKIRAGMTVAVREGSAGREMARIIPFLMEKDMNSLDRVMFCSDDLEAEELSREGHMDRILRRAIHLMMEQNGMSEEEAAVTAIGMATLHTARHYGRSASFLGMPPMGRIAPGFKADMVVFDSLRNMDIDTVMVDGVIVHGSMAEDRPALGVDAGPLKNTMNVGRHLTPKDFIVPYPRPEGRALVRCILAQENSLATGAETVSLPVRHGQVQSVPERRIAKIAVIERHHATGTMGVAFVRGLGILRGAWASTQAHDSHNLIVAGIEDADMAEVANAVVEMGGGMAVKGTEGVIRLPLPLGGLMWEGSVDALIRARKLLRTALQQTGTGLHDPFTTLSFLSLPVIPELKITNRGLVDVNLFAPVDLLA